MAIRLNVANNVRTRLSEGINDSITSITVDDASDFPSPPCYVTIYDTDPADGEIVEVTNVSTNTLTVLRGQQSTIAQSWSAGVKVALLGTAGEYNEMATEIDNHTSNVSNPHSVSAGQVDYDNTDSGLTATDVKGAIDEISINRSTIILEEVTSSYWTQKPQPNVLRNQTGITYYGGKIYVFRGEIETGYSNIVEAYDVNTETWVTLNNSPFTRFPIFAETVGNYIYLLGPKYNDDIIYEYDPSTDTYTIKKNGDLNIPGYGTTTSDGTYIYILSNSGSIKRYEPATNTISNWGSTREGRYPSAVCTNSYIYQMPGSGDADSSYWGYSFNKYLFRIDLSTGISEQIATISNNLIYPKVGMFPSTSNFGENIILITGKDYNTGEQRSYIYKETTGTMEELSNNPNYAYRPGVCSFTHDAGAETVYRIALIGGTDKSGNYVKLNQFMTDIENISDIFSPLSGIARNVDNSLIGVKKNDVITPSGSGTIIFIGTDSEM